MRPPIIDCITHISRTPDNVVGWGPRFLAEDLIAQLDADRRVLGEPARIDKAVVFPALGDTVPTSKLSFEEQHEYVAESVATYSDRLIGGIVMHARLWNDRIAAQLEKMVREQNFRMIYIHPSLHNYWLPVGDASVAMAAGAQQQLYEVFEAARVLKIPALIHTGEPPYGLPATVDSVAGLFPDLPIIIAHMGTQGEVFSLEAALVAKYNPNVYLETSFAQCHQLIYVTHALGAQRIIFGSNCPPCEPTQQLMLVEESLASEPPIGMSMPPDDLRKILGGNLAGLLAAVEPARTPA
ncbi:MAG: amidohydrolase family protein [Ardenticatenaceae bacterium]|nr:amidohydrolase family protein [Ardenticatenaceae bacterium]HBY97692.1 hypothetical protein [Chloroflexota bacterium]